MSGSQAGGPVRLAIRPGTSPSMQSHLSAALPAHEVTVVLMQAPEAVERLGTGDGVDAVVVYDPVGVAPQPVAPGAHVATVVVEPVWVLVGAKHPLAERDELSVQEIVDHGLSWNISPPDDPLRHWEQTLVLGRAPRAQLREAADLTPVDIIQGRAAELAGPVHLPEDLFAVRPLTPSATMHMYLTWQPHRLPGAIAGDLLSALRRILRDRARQNPRYWRWILDHPDHFPGIAPAPPTAPPTVGPTAAAAHNGGGLGLSEREREVLTLVAAGLNDTEIAHELHLSPLTVGTHVRNIRGKLGARDRVQLVVLAHQHGLTR